MFLTRLQLLIFLLHLPVNLWFSSKCISSCLFLHLTVQNNPNKTCFSSSERVDPFSALKNGVMPEAQLWFVRLKRLARASFCFRKAHAEGSAMPHVRLDGPAPSTLTFVFGKVTTACPEQFSSDCCQHGSLFSLLLSGGQVEGLLLT